MTSADGQTATIEGENVTANETGKKYIAYYPASVINGEGEYEFPTEQKFESEKLGSNIPLKAESDGNNLSFTCPCAVLDIKFSGSTISYIEVKYKIQTAEEENVIYLSKDGCHQEQGSGEPFSGEEFIIAIPAGSYSSLTILVKADDEKQVSLNTEGGNEKSFNAGYIYELNFDNIHESI